MNDMLSCFLAFLIGAGIGKAIVFVCETFIRKYYQSKKKISIIDDKHFSTSKYLEEIEKVHLSILEEKEKAKPYIITLWWGLDGCRLNDSGEVKWISRRTNPIPELKNSFHNVDFNYNHYTNTVYFQSQYLNYPYQYSGCGIQHMTNGINTMKVSYKGVTGDLVRLERGEVTFSVNSSAHVYKWELDVWDNEKGCKVSFHSVSLKDVKFLGGEVTYG